VFPLRGKLPLGNCPACEPRPVATGATRPTSWPPKMKPSPRRLGSAWRSPGRAGTGASAVGSHSALGRGNGGSLGRPTATAARPRSPTRMDASGSTCGRGSAIGQLSGSVQPTCAVGSLSSPAGSAMTRCWRAARCCCASSSSPPTKAIEVNPVRKVPPPKRRRDPEQVFGRVKRRALTPEEAGRLLACFPLFWWDHVTTFLGTGLRFGEPAGLRRRRVHLDRPVPIPEVGPPATRPAAGTAAASNPGPRATPASDRCRWLPWSSRRSADSFPLAATPMP
jgi:hypothetical protein